MPASLTETVDEEGAAAPGVVTMKIAPSDAMVQSTAPSAGDVGTRPSTVVPPDAADGTHAAAETEARRGEDHSESPAEADMDAAPPPLEPLHDVLAPPPQPGSGPAEAIIFRMRQRGRKHMPPFLGSSRVYGSTMRNGGSQETVLQFAALRVIARHASAYAARHTHRSKWKLMRALHHVNINFTLARLGLRAKLNAAQEISEAAATAVGEAWHHQADQSLHGIEVWQRRMRLRKHPLVCEQLRRWTTMIELPCRYADYKELMLRVYKVLVTPFHRKEAEEACMEDWQRDVLDKVSEGEKAAGGTLREKRERRSQLRLHRTPYMDALFELADHWTHSVSGEEYAKFLALLLRNVRKNARALRSLDEIEFTDLATAVYEPSEAQRREERDARDHARREHEAARRALPPKHAVVPRSRPLLAARDHFGTPLLPMRWAVTARLNLENNDDGEPVEDLPPLLPLPRGLAQTLWLPHPPLATAPPSSPPLPPSTAPDRHLTRSFASGPFDSGGTGADGALDFLRSVAPPATASIHRNAFAPARRGVHEQSSVVASSSLMAALLSPRNAATAPKPKASAPPSSPRGRFAAERQAEQWRASLAAELMQEGVGLPALRGTRTQHRTARHTAAAEWDDDWASGGAGGGNSGAAQVLFIQDLPDAPPPSRSESALPWGGESAVAAVAAAAVRAARAERAERALGAAADAADRAMLFGKTVLRPLPLPIPPCTPEDPLARQSTMAMQSAAFGREASPPHRRPPASPLFRAAHGTLGAHGMGFSKPGKLGPPPRRLLLLRPQPDDAASRSDAGTGTGRMDPARGAASTSAKASARGGRGDENQWHEEIMAPARAHGLMWRRPA